MILPKHKLEEIDYWEWTTEYKFTCSYPYTVITLHFKKWYKLRKKIYIMYSIDDKTDHCVISYSARELIHQLRDYFTNN